MRYVPCVTVQTTKPVFYFVSSKARYLFHKKRNPRVISWTVLYRKQHKKGSEEQSKRSRKRRAKKIERGIAGVSLEAIRAQKNQSVAQRNQIRAATKTAEKEQRKKVAAKKSDEKVRQDQFKKSAELKSKKTSAIKVQKASVAKKTPNRR